MKDEATPAKVRPNDGLGGTVPKRDPGQRTAVCEYCKQPDNRWSAHDLLRGKRGLKPGPGVEYHCMNAFYGAQ